MKYDNMTNEQIKSRIRELSTILNNNDGYNHEVWNKAYKEYCELSAIQDARYEEEHRDSFNAFYEEHIKGKSWEEIDPEDWDFYSDWHKDMYGYRPRTI
jgi:hypothetical protein